MRKKGLGRQLIPLCLQVTPLCGPSTTLCAIKSEVVCSSSVPVYLSAPAAPLPPSAPSTISSWWVSIIGLSPICLSVSRNSPTARRRPLIANLAGVNNWPVNMSVYLSVESVQLSVNHAGASSVLSICLSVCVYRPMPLAAAKNAGASSGSQAASMALASRA
jgi:hypothetical protein